MKHVIENVVSDVPGQDHLHAIIKHVKDDIPRRHKNPREVRAYRPTSRWTHLLTCSKFYTTVLYSFKAISEQYMVMNKQNAGCSHFFGPLGRYIWAKWTTTGRIALRYALHDLLYLHRS